jgi:serine/threonine protein kinase
MNTEKIMMNQILHGRYQLKSLLGRKTGRRTFLAQDLASQENIVVKLMLFNVDFVWDDLKLFDREVEVLKSLDLAAIPQYLDSFEADTELGKGFALVQTYIEARSLQDWVESGRTFSESEIKIIAKKLLDILDYLHHRQPPVIHRDLKPSNILLADRSGNSPGEVYLIDFGSVQTTPSNSTITIVGTYGYMPPEQFGGKVSPASDLYALGATLIYLATGSHPSELPQQELRILFAERVHLRPQTIAWLQWLTEPSLDLRPRSARSCLDTIGTANLTHPVGSIFIKPYGSRVKIKNTPERFEVIIPPNNFKSALIYYFLYLVFTHILLIEVFGIAAYSLYFTCIISMSCLLLMGSCTTKLIIDRLQISHTSSIFGLRYWFATTIPRTRIIQIEFTKLHYTGGPYTVAVSPRINIWSGIHKIEFGGDESLSPIELDWLATELRNWLYLTGSSGITMLK